MKTKCQCLTLTFREGQMKSMACIQFRKMRGDIFRQDDRIDRRERMEELENLED